MAFLDTTDKSKPAYQHQEYPKHINFVDGKFKVANDAAEETLILAENVNRLIKPKSPEGEAVINESEVLKKAKATLVNIAEKLGIEIDKRWSTEKINEAINEAFSAQVAPESEADKKLKDEEDE